MWIELFEYYFGRYSRRAWSARFGSSVSVVDIVFRLLRPHCIFEPVRLLWALNFLRCYATAETAHSTWKVCERTYRDSVWKTIFLMYEHLDFVHLRTRFHNPEVLGTYLILDSTLCPIETDRTDWERQKLWYDGHHRRHGIKYEVAVHASSGEVHWVSGGVFGSTADITLLRNGGLLQQLQAGEHIFADKGYYGEGDVLLGPYKGRTRDLPPNQRTWNRFLKRRRVRVEHALGRIKRFQCCRLPWRHALRLHPVMYRVCSQLAAASIRAHPLRANAPENPTYRLLDPALYDADDEADFYN